MSAVTAATSPVAGLFLAMVAVAAIASVSRRQGLLLAASALVPVVVMVALFPEGGRQPYDLAPAALALVLCALMALSVRPRFASVRRAALLYIAAIVVAYVLPTAMGSNVTRFGVLFGGPALLCTTRADRRWLACATGAGLAVWTLWGPVSEVTKATASPATSAAYFRPLERFLSRAGAADGRVEVVPTSTRWESVYIARRFNLARGWETQLDHRYNNLFYHRHLDPSAYHRWLLGHGVRFVVLADAPFERWGAAEARVVASHPSWLKPVWRNAHWRVLAVRGATAMVTGPMRLRSLSSDDISVSASRRGLGLLRVRYTPFWSSTGPGCVAAGPGGWTLIRADKAGIINVHAAWTIGGLLRRPDCSREPDDPR